jgi:hypothetical protein
MSVVYTEHILHLYSYVTNLMFINGIYITVNYHHCPSQTYLASYRYYKTELLFYMFFLSILFFWSLILKFLWRSYQSSGCSFCLLLTYY